MELEIPKKPIPKLTPRFLKQLETREAKGKEPIPKDPVAVLEALIKAQANDHDLFLSPPTGGPGPSGAGNYDDEEREDWSYTSSTATSPRSIGEREPKEILNSTANFQLQQLTRRFPNIEVGLVSPSTSKQSTSSLLPKSIHTMNKTMNMKPKTLPPQLIKFPSGTTITKSPPQLIVQQPTKHTSIAFQCPHCNSLFRTQDSLAVHMFQRHGSTSMQDEDEYSSEDQSGSGGGGGGYGGYDMDMEMDYADPPGLGSNYYGTDFVQCKHCPKKFSNQSELRQHLLMHTRERPFSCKYCGKRFFQSSHLTVHIRIHTGEKPYKCQYCEMTFNSPSNCRVHERTHNKGNEIYTCQECGIGFLHKSRLDRHLKSKKHVSEPLAQYYQGQE